MRLAQLALGLLLSSWIMGQAKAVTIDFATAPSGIKPLPFSENGFTFTDLNLDWVTSGSDDVLYGGGTGTVRLSRTDSGIFDLLSLDVKLRSSLDALGTFGLLTSLGGTRDLSAVGHYTFAGAGFEGLSWVDMTIVKAQFYGDNTYVDNIVVNNAVASVPESGPTLFLLLLSFGGMLALRTALQSNSPARPCAMPAPVHAPAA